MNYDVVRVIGEPPLGESRQGTITVVESHASFKHEHHAEIYAERMQKDHDDYRAGERPNSCGPRVVYRVQKAVAD